MSEIIKYHKIICSAQKSHYTTQSAQFPCVLLAETALDQLLLLVSDLLSAAESIFFKTFIRNLLLFQRYQNYFKIISDQCSDSIMCETVNENVLDQELLEEFDDDDGLNDMLQELDDNSQQQVNNELSQGQKKRMEKNKLKALALKKAKLMAHPYNNKKLESKTTVSKEKKLVDGGGGFFIEDDDEDTKTKETVITELPPPIMPPDQPNCDECDKDFADSYLFRTFDHPVCDDCKNMERDGPHELITKTDAKKQFLLTDAHFERDGNPLKFLLRKNPHNPRYGDMKLFLRLQIEKVALDVWGSEEDLEAEIEKREANKVLLKEKKYQKKMKELRKAVRSSLFTKNLAAHTHKYGEETYDEDKDEYSKTCDECGHVLTYEKM